MGNRGNVYVVFYKLLDKVIRRLLTLLMFVFSCVVVGTENNQSNEPNVTNKAIDEILQEQQSSEIIEQEQVIERITVTGSRLKGIDGEISSPVLVITREDIDASGATRLADVLRASPINSHGSRRESAGGTTQGQATLNLRGLGEQRTLVLINGHRIANSAAIPDAQNINLIPLTAIERVEILKDGASSLYGADAIGGVVNIILRKNIQTNHLSLFFLEPNISGGQESYAGFYGGITNNIANISYAFEYQTKAAIYARDVKLTEQGYSNYGYPGSYRINTVHPQTGQKLTKVTTDSRCPDSLGQSNFPNSKREGGFCQFNFAQYLQLLPESKNRSAMLDSVWQLGLDNSVYAHLDFSVNSTQGIGAPTPTAGGEIFLPTMTAANVNNPTQGQTISFDSNFDGVNDTYVDGPFDLDIYYRHVLGEVRKTDNTDKMLNLYAGFSGELGKATNYEFTVFFNSNKSTSYVDGLVRRDLLQAAIDDGQFDIFSVNGSPNTELAKGFVIDSEFEALFKYQGAKFIYHYNIFKQGEDLQDSVLGLEYVEHDYQSVFKDEFTDNLIDGRAGGGSAKGQRQIFSIFGESSYDITKLLNLNFSVRYDHYSDFGDSLNPKLGLSYRYNSDLIIRVSAGTGFRAPSLYELYSQKNQSLAFVRDYKQCHAAGDLDNNGIADHLQNVDLLTSSHPCQPLSVEAVISGNSSLEAETSASFTSGFTYENKNNTRLHLNLYYQYFDNEISLLSNDELLHREQNHGGNGGIIRDEQGQLTRILQLYNNFSGTKTAGIDIEYDINWQTKSSGTFTSSTGISATIFHKVEMSPGDGFNDLSGELGKSEGRLYTALKWQKADWKSQISFDFQPSTQEYDIKLSSYLVTNFSLQKQLLKNSKLRFGLLNVFNSKPPSNNAIGWPYYFADELFIQGRTLYLNFSYTI